MYFEEDQLCFRKIIRVCLLVVNTNHLLLPNSVISINFKCSNIGLNLNNLQKLFANSAIIANTTRAVAGRIRAAAEPDLDAGRDGHSAAVVVVGDRRNGRKGAGILQN